MFHLHEIFVSPLWLPHLTTLYVAKLSVVWHANTLSVKKTIDGHRLRPPNEPSLEKSNPPGHYWRRHFDHYYFFSTFFGLLVCNCCSVCVCGHNNFVYEIARIGSVLILWI